MNELLLKKNKFDKYLLINHNKIFVIFVVLILFNIILYVYFLFMSIFYTYAQLRNSNILDRLIVKNVELKSELIKYEKEREITLSNRFVKLTDINYIKTNTSFVLNYNK